MKLIVEEVVDTKYITEEVGGKKQLYIEGVYLQSEKVNRNGRKYAKETLSREVNRYIKEKVEGNRAWGELGHPDSPNINLDRVCMRITSLKEDGNDWIGKAMVITETNHGKIVEALINSGGNLGVSSRGCGSMKKGRDGIIYVQEDFRLATAADVVADPSAPDAFVNGIMEGKEWVWDNGVVKEVDINEIYLEVKKAKKAQLEEACLKAFKSFVDKL